MASSTPKEEPANPKSFSLEGRSLKLDTDKDLEPHIAKLRAMDDVEEVKVLGNTLGVTACKLLGEVLATKKTLRVANFADIFTGRLLNEIPEALSYLLTSIQNLPNLTTINLNDNAFGLNTKDPIVSFLSSHVPLQHLHLTNNGLGPHAGISVADALSELHAKKEAARKSGQDVPNLETVICGRNRLENGSMKAWARCFKLNNHVKTIKMVQNGIRQEGIAVLLSEGLNEARTLEVLDLQDNTFTLVGAQALARAAANWVNIEELGLGDSLLGDDGGVALADALAKEKNAKLRTLRLQFNEIEANGAAVLAKAAKSLPALQKMELNGNMFSATDDAVVALEDLFIERKDILRGGVINEDEWGLDELDEMDFSDEGESESESEKEEEEEEGVKKVVRGVAMEGDVEKDLEDRVQDKAVDALADALGKTGI